MSHKLKFVEATRWLIGVYYTFLFPYVFEIFRPSSDAGSKSWLSASTQVGAYSGNEKDK